MFSPLYTKYTYAFGDIAKCSHSPLSTKERLMLCIYTTINIEHQLKAIATFHQTNNFLIYNQTSCLISSSYNKIVGGCNILWDEDFTSIKYTNQYILPLAH